MIAEKFPNLDRDLNILAHELTGLPKISTWRDLLHETCL